MGFVTESQMRTDYEHLFTKDVVGTQYKLQGWMTPDGILVEVIKETMESQSTNEEVITSKLINRRTR